MNGVVWATVVGYASAWLLGKFSGFGLVVLAIALAAQVVCFALWWHYMTEVDRSVEKFAAAQGVSLDVPTRRGWTGFVERHPILSGVAVSVVLLGLVVVLALGVNHELP